MEEDWKNHKKGAKSTDTTATVDTTATNGTREASPTAENKMEKEEAGVTMAKEELLKQRMYYSNFNSLSEINIRLFCRSRGYRIPRRFRTIIQKRQTGSSYGRWILACFQYLEGAEHQCSMATCRRRLCQRTRLWSCVASFERKR